MDIILTHQEQREPICFSPFSILSYWVSKSTKKLCKRARISSGFCCRGLDYKGMMVNNSTFCSSPVFLEEVAEKCDAFGEKSGSNSDESSSSSSTLMGWPVHRKAAEEGDFDGGEMEREVSSMSDMEMMKERFSKLLLGEDMSGSGNGVCTALAISNAITNLSGSLFGQVWRLEPLALERKAMWRREMEWLLCVSNHIVELIPIWQTFPDGTKLEIMTCRPRSDLYVNLPALHKLDHMLLDILDSFVDSEFLYVDKGIVGCEMDGCSSFGKVVERQEDKWWLPIPRVPIEGGLSEASRKQLHHNRDCANQILKAAMAINSLTLADMDVPHSYLEALPKNGRSSLGEAIYRYISSDEFSAVWLLECLDISSEHQAIEIANRVEAAMYTWRKGIITPKQTNKSSWEMLKELVIIDADKTQLFAERAESLLFCLKQHFPNLPQTNLDMTKIQYNKDVGKAILESYSRVLESLAFNIVARIEDLIYVDDLTKHSDQIPSISQLGIVAHNSSNQIQFSLPFSSSPCTTFRKPSFSPIPISSNINININMKGRCGDLIEESEKSQFSKGQDLMK